jgi:hypothetical protein
LAAHNNAAAACELLAERGANQHIKARDGKSAVDVLRSVNRALADRLEAVERKAGVDKLVATAQAQWLAQYRGLRFDARETLRSAATVERIREGRFDPLSDPLVKKAAQEPHSRTMLVCDLASLFSLLEITYRRSPAPFELNDDSANQCARRNYLAHRHDPRALHRDLHRPARSRTARFCDSTNH